MAKSVTVPNSTLEPQAHHGEEDFRMFGFIVFLLSESIIFLSFFIGYAVYKLNAVEWLPVGFEA